MTKMSEIKTNNARIERFAYWLEQFEYGSSYYEAGKLIRALAVERDNLREAATYWSDQTFRERKRADKMEEERDELCKQVETYRNTANTLAMRVIKAERERDNMQRIAEKVEGTLGEIVMTTPMWESDMSYSKANIQETLEEIKRIAWAALRETKENDDK